MLVLMFCCSCLEIFNNLIAELSVYKGSLIRPWQMCLSRDTCLCVCGSLLYHLYVGSDAACAQNSGKPIIHGSSERSGGSTGKHISPGLGEQAPRQPEKTCFWLKTELS